MAAAMGTTVREATLESVVLAVPLGPNTNLHATAFGGSVAAQGILAGWTLVHVRLETEGIPANTVIQWTEIDYLHPIHHDFEVHTLPVETRAWDRLFRSIARWGRGRVRVASEVRCQGVLAAHVTGDYVALDGPPLDESPEGGPPEA